MNKTSSFAGRQVTTLHPRGFSLIEVILATAILLGSVVVLSQLAGIGRTHAQNAQSLSQVQRICENTLNEVLLGIRPLAPVEAAPLLPVAVEEPLDEPQGEILAPARNQDRLTRSTDSARWLHTIRIEPEQGTPGLSSLTVEVMEARRSGSRRIRFALTRWIRQSSAADPLRTQSDAILETGGFSL